MVPVEAGGEGADFFDEAIGGVVEVVEMDFNVGDAGMGEFCEGVEDFGLVLLFGVEKGVARRTARCVLGSIGGDLRPAALPGGDAGAANIERYITAHRLIVVGEGDPEALAWAATKLACAIAEVRHKPEICVSRKLHQHPSLW